MNSPPHRANLLDPQLDSIGIAVVDRNGQLFAVEDFSLAVADLSLEEQEHLLASTLRTRGLHLINGSSGSVAAASGASAPANEIVDDARQTCSLDKGFAGKHQPAFQMRYTSPNLKNLPGALEQQIKSGRYHSAAVGACQPNGKTELGNYRVAVLLYQ